jgi:hypothetical protein
MLPLSYQTILRKHLNESQYLTLQLLVLLLQTHRQVKLSVLASVFPQPIQYRSRKRNLQRFLVLPQLCVKLLWFPLIKSWIRQEQTGRSFNRERRCSLKTLKHHEYGYWIVAIDRTQWKGHNLFMVSVIWGTHALPLYWEVLKKPGNSDLRTQKRLLSTVLSLFISCLGLRRPRVSQPQTRIMTRCQGNLLCPTPEKGLSFSTAFR